MRAIVIGSEGNIGNPLVNYLKNCEYEVKEIDIKQGYRNDYFVCDINQPVDLLPAFDWKPDVVFLLSAMVSRVTCEQAAGLSVTTNLSGINNVIQLCKRTDSKLVFFSTSEVYGPNHKIMDESNIDLKPNNRYGLTKLLGEKIVEYECKFHGLKAIILRPFMIYDEKEEPGDHRSAMIRFATNLIAGKPIQVHINCERGWMHISDAVRAIEKSTYIQQFTIINIGSDEIVSMESLAISLCQEIGSSKNLIQLIEQPIQMTKIKRPSLLRQKSILGIEIEVSLKEGIKRVCNISKQILSTTHAKATGLWPEQNYLDPFG
jgi:nucleoside-diphosphate-sugar epimerase